MNKQIIDNVNSNNELINNDLMFGYTNYELMQLLVMLLSKSQYNRFFSRAAYFANFTAFKTIRENN